MERVGILPPISVFFSVIPSSAALAASGLAMRIKPSVPSLLVNERNHAVLLKDRLQVFALDIVFFLLLLLLLLALLGQSLLALVDFLALLLLKDQLGHHGHGLVVPLQP